MGTQDEFFRKAAEADARKDRELAEAKAALARVESRSSEPQAPSGPVAVYVQRTSLRRSNLGIAGIIIGLLCLSVAWIPIVGFSTIWLSPIGLLLSVVGGILAMTSEDTSVNLPAWGVLICLAAIAAPFVTTGLLVGATVQAVQQVQADAKEKMDDNGRSYDPAPASRNTAPANFDKFKTKPKDPDKTPFVPGPAPDQ